MWLASLGVGGSSLIQAAKSFAALHVAQETQRPADDAAIDRQTPTAMGTTPIVGAGSKRDQFFFNTDLVPTKETDGFVYTRIKERISVYTNLDEHSGSVTLWARADISAVLRNDQFAKNALTVDQVRVMRRLDSNPELRAVLMREQVPAAQMERFLTHTYMPAVRQLLQSDKPGSTLQIEVGVTYAQMAGKPNSPYRLLGLDIGGKGSGTAIPALQSVLRNFTAHGIPVSLLRMHTHPDVKQTNGKYENYGFFSDTDIRSARIGAHLLAYPDQSITGVDAGGIARNVAVQQIDYGTTSSDNGIWPIYRMQTTAILRRDSYGRNPLVEIEQTPPRYLQGPGPAPARVLQFTRVAFDSQTLDALEVVPTRSVADGNVTAIPAKQHDETYLDDQTFAARVFPTRRAQLDPEQSAARGVLLSSEDINQIRQQGGGRVDIQVVQRLAEMELPTSIDESDARYGAVDSWTASGVRYGDTLPADTNTQILADEIVFLDDIRAGYASDEKVLPEQVFMRFDGKILMTTNPATGEEHRIEANLPPAIAQSLKMGDRISIELVYDFDSHRWEFVDLTRLPAQK
jgi:hypothetical protein